MLQETMLNVHQNILKTNSKQWIGHDKRLVMTKQS